MKRNDVSNAHVCKHEMDQRLETKAIEFCTFPTWQMRNLKVLLENVFYTSYGNIAVLVPEWNVSMMTFIYTTAICVKRRSSMIIEFREPKKTENEISQWIRKEPSQGIRRLRNVSTEFDVMYVSRLIYKGSHIIGRPHIIWCINYRM